MRIYSISNNINFGYNRDLNEKVKSRLKNDTKNQEVNAQILQLNEICNNAEDKLKEASLKNDWVSMSYYEDMFNTLKPYLANQFVVMYPKLILFEILYIRI